MDMYSATETAYKNGYNKALEDFIVQVACKAELTDITHIAQYKLTISTEELVEIKQKLEKI